MNSIPNFSVVNICITMISYSKVLHCIFNSWGNGLSPSQPDCQNSLTLINLLCNFCTHTVLFLASDLISVRSDRFFPLSDHFFFFFFYRFTEISLKVLKMCTTYFSTSLANLWMKIFTCPTGKIMGVFRPTDMHYF